MKTLVLVAGLLAMLLPAVEHLGSSEFGISQHFVDASYSVAD